MSEFAGHAFLYNGKEQSIDQQHIVGALIKENPALYEVVRIEDGVPLFLEDYLLRLENSFDSINKVKLYSNEEISNSIQRLIKINHHKNGPVKLVFGVGDVPFFIVFLMKAHLPKPEEYITGVQTVLLEEERKNPSAKIWNESLRNKSTKLIEEQQVYEAILVNESGYITEASRSNVFFITSDIVYTTPVDFVLPGITRKKVLEVCREKSIEVNFKSIHKNDLSLYHACFLTGTARQVVPIKKINDLSFSVENKILAKITSGFDAMVSKYISRIKER